MAYIVGSDRYQTQIITTSLDELIDKEYSVRVIDAYVDSLDLSELGFIEYSGTNRGQAPYLKSDLLKLHIYGYLNRIRSSRALEVEAKRNLELMWLINSVAPDHGTIAGFVQKNKSAFHNVLRNLTLILKGWGLIDGKLVAIDGTKIRAHNKSNCITQSGLDRKIGYAEAQINAYMMAMNKGGQQTENYKEKLQAFVENTSKNRLKYRKYKCKECDCCPYKEKCTSSVSGRTLQRWEYENVLEAVYFDTCTHNDVYKQRRCIVEHPFGTIKRSLGYRYFLRRRLDNVDAGTSSMFIAYNLKRLLSMFTTCELVEMMAIVA